MCRERDLCSPLSPGPANAQKHTHTRAHLWPFAFPPPGPDRDSRLTVTAVGTLLGPQQWFSRGSPALQARVATSGNILIVRSWPGWVLLASGVGGAKASAERPVTCRGAPTTKNPLSQMSGAVGLTNQRPPSSVCREVWWVSSLDKEIGAEILA